MLRLRFIGLSAALLATTMATAQAQTAAPPPTPPRKWRARTTSTSSASAAIVDVYRHQGRRHRHRPDQRAAAAAKAYIEEIQKIHQGADKYVIYSHSHYDHIAGGKPFKDLGATFIAHRNAKARIAALKPADVVVPDQVVDNKKVIKLGGTTLELLYVGKKPLRQHIGDAIAEGEDHLHRRLDSSAGDPVPRHGGQLSA